MTQFVSSASNGYTLKLNVTETSYNTTNNTSDVAWSVECSCTGAYAQWNPGPGTVSVTIDGANLYDGRPSFVFPGLNSTITLCSGSFTTTHNADGTKKLSCSASYSATSSAYYLPGSMSCSGDLELTNIPRATQPTVSKSSVYIGSSVTINTPRASSDFTHTLRYSFQGKTGQIATKVATSKAWTVPTSFINDLPDSVAGTVMIYCDTYNGSTLIGTKSVDLVVQVPVSYKPTIKSITVTEATAGLASQFGVFVQSKSSFKIVTSSSGINGSTIETCVVKVEGATYTGTTVTTDVINSSGNIKISVSVMDSRGRVATSEKTVNVVAYSPPTITISSVTRATSAGIANDDGVYALCNYAYSITNVNNKNTHTFKIQYKSGNSWIDMVTYTDYTKSGKYISSLEFDVDNAHDFRFVVTDYFGTYAIEKRMEVSFDLYNVGSDGHSFMFGGQAKDKPGYLGSYLPFAPLGGQCIHNANGTSGSTGYVLIMRLVTSQTYINSPMRFAIIRRGDFMSTDVFLKFANANSVDPTVEKFIARGATRDIYVVKSSTSTFDIYVKKAEAYDTIAITAFERNYGNLGTGVSVSYRNTHATSLPSGYKQADDYRLHDGTFYIGCVITDTTGVNPSTRYGGTWEVFAPGRSLIGAGTGNDGSTSMTFTANQSGGDYKHQHQYGLLYGEYFGLHSRELKLFTNDLNNNGSWQVSSLAGYQSQDAFNNGNASVINSQSNQYQNYAKTETKKNLAPYFVVSRWRRTA